MIKDLIGEDEKSQRRRRIIDRLRLFGFYREEATMLRYWVAWVGLRLRLFNTAHVASKLLPRMRLRLSSFLQLSSKKLASFLNYPLKINKTLIIFLKLHKVN